MSEEFVGYVSSRRCVIWSRLLLLRKGAGRLVRLVVVVHGVQGDVEC